MRTYSDWLVLNLIFAFIFGQSVELLRWGIDRSTGPNIRIDSGITSVARNFTTYLGEFGGGT